MDDWGKATMETSKVSEHTQAEVDKEINKLVNDAHDRAAKLLKENKEKLEKIANLLVAQESLNKEEFEEAMK